MKYILVLSAFFSSWIATAQEDPYIWMEEVESEKSLEWVNHQNQLTKEKISKIEGFNELQHRFEEVYNDKDKIVYPSTIGEFVYNFWKDDTHKRGIWRRTKRSDFLSGNYTWETILDIDALSEKEGKKWVFHGANWLEPDYATCLISLSDGGTDENEVREFDVTSKSFVKDGFFLPSSKGSASWITKDELLVSRTSGEGTMTTSGYPRIVKRLKRGQKLNEASILMEEPDTIMGVWGYTDFEDGKYSIHISKSESFYSHQSYILKDTEIFALPLPLDADNEGYHKGQLLYTLNSDWTVGNTTYKIGSLISVEREKLYQGKLNVQLVYLPDSKSSVNGILVTKDKVVLTVLQNVQNVLLACNFDSNKWTVSDLKTPEFGRISIVDGDDKHLGYFYEYSNYITPPTLYYVEGNETKVIQEQHSLFDSKNLEVHQYEVISKDGTVVPYFIVHRKDLKFDGNNPTLVYAYGGFNISQKPSYNSTTGIGWLEQGGVYVVASIRGGGEFGPSWHKAAMKENRQNAYNDFYAVCEDLIQRKITSQPHLGAFGWSNGGLMAGVVATQRPDLFNAVIIGAPLLDMKRFNKMLAGASWMGEYGNPDVPEEWEYIKKYSPYHNVFKEKKYPEVLFVTSTKDDRVHPAHARKMAARMIEQGHPIFYYETLEGGHGASSTNEQLAFNQALMYSYLRMKLN